MMNSPAALALAFLLASVPAARAASGGNFRAELAERSRRTPDAIFRLTPTVPEAFRAWAEAQKIDLAELTVRQVEAEYIAFVALTRMASERAAGVRGKGEPHRAGALPPSRLRFRGLRAGRGRRSRGG